MIAILSFSVLVCLLYIQLIYRYSKGWDAIPECPKLETPESFSSIISDGYIVASVIVAFRNEEKALPELLKALYEQSYPAGFYEIIFVDDHSDDRSVSLIQKFVSESGNARLLRCGPDEYGKKKALSLAAKVARGELLLFTDADCIPTRNWIYAAVSCYSSSQPILIAMPVVMKSDNRFFDRFQSIEFFSLTAATAGSFGNFTPIMVNGANLAVERQAYLKSLEYLQPETLSGDDVFLLFHLKRKCPDKLIFLKSTDAIVEISPVHSLKSFLRQRLRWTYKARYYRDKHVIYSALIVLLMTVCLLNCFILSFFSTEFIYFGGLVFLAKSTIDYAFLRKILRYFGKEKLLGIFVVSQFLYFFYVSFTGIAGIIYSGKWKGREVNQQKL